HNVAGIVALAAALAETDAEGTDVVPRVAALKARLLDGLATVGGVTETVPRESAVAGIAHVCIDGIESEALLYLLDEGGVCGAASSACTAGAVEPSHVLTAIGVT